MLQENDIPRDTELGVHPIIMPSPQIGRLSWAQLMPLGRIWKELRCYKKTVLLTQLACILAMGFGMVIPFGLKYFAEQIQEGNIHILLWAPPLSLALAFFIGVMHMARSFLTQYITLLLSKDLQVRIYGKYMRQDLLEQFCMPVGDKLSRITFDLHWFTEGATLFLSETFYAPLTAVVSLGIMFYLEWRLAVIVIMLAPLSLLIGKPISRLLSQSIRKLQSQNALLTRHITDTLRGMVLVKVFGREDMENTTLDRLLSQLLRTNIINNFWGGLFSLAVNLGNALVICLAAWTAFYLISRGSELSFPSLAAFTAVTFFLFGEISKLGNTMTVMARASASCERIFGFLDQPENKLQAGEQPASFEREISLDRVSFAYDKGPVIEDVSLCIKPGDKVALVGMSGAGKTTLIRLMIGLLRPDSGRLLVDGVDARQIAPEQLKDLFGYSPQMTFLFYASVLDNIRYSRPQATLDEVRMAAQQACAHEFIAKLPQQYDSIIGEEGSQLSEGQKQRIAIARSVVKDAPIIILDESSSQVDLITENQIYKKLISQPGKTLIIISHRPSVLDQVDRIFSVAQGRVREVTNLEGVTGEEKLKRILDW